MKENNIFYHGNPSFELSQLIKAKKEELNSTYPCTEENCKKFDPELLKSISKFQLEKNASVKYNGKEQYKYADSHCVMTKFRTMLSGYEAYAISEDYFCGDFYSVVVYVIDKNSNVIYGVSTNKNSISVSNSNSCKDFMAVKTTKTKDAISSMCFDRGTAVDIDRKSEMDRAEKEAKERRERAAAQLQLNTLNSKLDNVTNESDLNDIRDTYVKNSDKIRKSVPSDQINAFVNKAKNMKEKLENSQQS